MVSKTGAFSRFVLLGIRNPEHIKKDANRCDAAQNKRSRIAQLVPQ